MTKNKGVTSIPEWFDIKKYESASNLSFIDFGLNLIVRVHVFHWLNQNKNTAIPEHATKLIDYIKIYGLLSKDKLTEFYADMVEGILNDSKRGWNQGPGLGVVSTLPLKDAYEIYEVIHKDTWLRSTLASIDYLDILNPAKKESLSGTRLEMVDWYENIFVKGSISEIKTDVSDFSFENIVSVDTNASDEMLIEGFKDWLKTFRALNGNHDNESSSEEKYLFNDLGTMQKRCVKAAILPYADLKMHEKLTGAKLADHRMGDAILSSVSDVDTTESIRKTTRPLARRVFNKAAFIFFRKAIILEKLSKTQS